MSTHTDTQTATQTMPDRQRWTALYVLCAGMLMIVLDATIVNVALPSIHEDLDFTQSGLAWVVNAYLIAFAGLLLLAGRLGDLLGQRRVFLAGLAAFTVASVACALAQNQETLIVARFLQGVGGAMSSAVVLGMIVTMFPDPHEQAKALGVYGFVASAGGSIGLLLGGVLTQAISWHWIFLINVPVGIVTAALAVRVIEDRPGLGFSRGADLPGAALLTAGLMIGVYTILQAGENGWVSSSSASLGVVAVALLLAFVVRQARIDVPLLPLRVFRSAHVTFGNIVQALVVVGMFGVFFLSALYLSEVRGYGPLEVGLTFLPSSVVMGVISLRLSGPLSMKFGPRATLLGGLVSILAGLTLFARLPVDANLWVDIAPAMMLFGGGAGFVFPALMSFAMSAATPEDAGVASGLVNTSMQVGGALGLAVLATISTEHSKQLAEHGAAQAAALTGGFQVAFGVGAVLVAVALVIAFVTLRPSTSPTGEPVLVAA